jgi:hypothetical protein
MSGEGDMMIDTQTKNTTSNQKPNIYKKKKAQEPKWNYILVQDGISYPHTSEPYIDAKYIKSQWAKKLRVSSTDTVVNAVWAKMMKTHSLTSIKVSNGDDSVTAEQNYREFRHATEHLHHALRE